MTRNQSIQCGGGESWPDMKSTHEDSRYLGLAELSQKLSMSPRSLRSYIRQPDNPLPAYRLGRKYLFFLPEVMAWIRTHKVKTVDVDVIVTNVLNNLQGDSNGKDQGTKGTGKKNQS